jgi:hypothetical protein
MGWLLKYNIWFYVAIKCRAVAIKSVLGYFIFLLEILYSQTLYAKIAKLEERYGFQ